MNENAPLNFDPFATDLMGLINGLIKKSLQQFQTCIPALVKKVESANRVIVSPAVQQTDANWNPIEWADIALPVLVPFGGGVIMSWPLSVGDTGWIIAGDLDPSLFFADTTKPAKQNLLNRHSYQYGFFMPAKLGNYTLEKSDDDALVIMTEDGKTKIALKSGNVNITSSDTLNINGKSINIKTDDNASVTIDGVNWKNHQHDVTAGTGQVVVAVNTSTNTGTNTAPLTWTSAGVKS